MLRELRCPVLQLGQRDVQRVRQPPPGELARLAHVEDQRILAVDEPRRVERADLADGRHPIFQQRPQQHGAGHDEHQQERPVPDDEIHDHDGHLRRQSLK